MSEETNETPVVPVAAQESTPATPETTTQVEPEKPAEVPAKEPDAPAAAETPKETPAVAEAKKAMHVTIKVSNKPKKDKPAKKGLFNPNDAKAKKAWIAQKHQEQQESLVKNGYSATAVVSIMRYMTTNHGYEKKQAKDHLIFMFERLARSMKYSLDVFDRNMSSMLAILLIDINGHLSQKRDLLDMPAAESQKFVIDTINRVWKAGGGDAAGRDMQFLKQYVQKALILKAVDGYAARAKYFFECVIDTTMKMVDPFESLYHTERVEMTEEIRQIMHMPVKKEWPKKFCEKCGQEMKWIFPLKRHICTNVLCTEYRPPRRGPGNGPRRPYNGEGGEQQTRPPRRTEKISRQHDGGYDSGKPIDQTSASDKFKQRYAGKKPMKPHQPIHGSIGPKDADGKAKKFGANPFDALDALKAPAETPTPTVDNTTLPPPPAEQPVV